MLRIIEGLAVSAAVLASLAAAACGAGESNSESVADDSSDANHTHADGTDHTHAGEEPGSGQQLTYEDLSQTEEFLAADALHQVCMAEAGYPDLDDPEGILLKDGTRWNGSSFAIEGAMIDLLSNWERCEIESGLAVLKQQHGYGPQMDAAAVTAGNDRMIRQMACMEARGWDIPEPATVPQLGFLVFDIQISPEEHAAYDLDLAACAQEMVGG